MPKITKQGPSHEVVSTTLTARSHAIVPVVVDADTHDLVPTGALEVPQGTVKEVVAWIGTDPERAAAAIAGDERKGVLSAAHDVLEADE